MGQLGAANSTARVPLSSVLAVVVQLIESDVSLGAAVLFAVAGLSGGFVGHRIRAGRTGGTA